MLLGAGMLRSWCNSDLNPYIHLFSYYYGSSGAHEPKIIKKKKRTRGSFKIRNWFPARVLLRLMYSPTLSLVSKDLLQARLLQFMALPPGLGAE